MILKNKAGKTVLLILIIILMAGFSLRFNFFINKLHDFYLVGDAKNYQIMSQQIVENGVYGYALKHKSGHPNAYVTPGYPLFLSGAYAVVRDPYRQITIVRFLQVIIGGIISPLLAFLFVLRLLKKNSIALLTALFTAIYPTYILSSTYILTEVCSLATMLLYFYLQTLSLQDKKPYQSILAGLAFAFNILIRPTMFPLLVLPFVFAFFVWKKVERVILYRLFLYTLIGVIIPMLPWWVRNYVTLHKFILLSTGSGDPLLAGTYPYMTGLFQDYLSEKVRVTEVTYARKRIVEGFISEPLLYIKWYTIGKLKSLFEKPWLYARPPHPSIISFLIYKSHYPMHHFFITAGTIGTIIGSVKKNVLLFVSIYTIILLGLLLIFIPESRYAYHIMFFLMLFSSYILCYTANIFKDILSF